MDLKPTLEQVIQQSDSTKAIIKDLARRLKQAGEAMNDVRLVKKLTEQLRGLELEFQDFLEEAQRAQARAKSVVRMAAKPMTPEQIRATPGYKAAVTDHLLWIHRRDMAALAEKRLFAQVAGKA